MILEYDKSPHATVDQKITTLMNSVQRALETLEKNKQNITLSDAQIQAVVDKIYPVGSIYIEVNNVEPSEDIGGKWDYIGGHIIGETLCYFWTRKE